MDYKIITVSAALLLSGCIDEKIGPGGQSKSNSKISSESGSYAESNAGDGSSGTTIFIPASSELDAQKIRIEEGASVANQTTAAYLSIPGTVEQASASVMITHEEFTYVENPGSLIINLPIQAASTSLNLVSEKHLVVFYHIFSSNKGDLVYGVIPTTEISVSAGIARFAFVGFGSYQLAYVETRIESAIRTPTTTSVATRSGSVIRFKTNPTSGTTPSTGSEPDDDSSPSTQALKTWSVKEVPNTLNTNMTLIPAISPDGKIIAVMADEASADSNSGIRCAVIHREQTWSEPVCIQLKSQAGAMDYSLMNAQVLVSDRGDVSVLFCGPTTITQAQKMRYAFLSYESSRWLYQDSEISTGAGAASLSCQKLRLDLEPDGKLVATTNLENAGMIEYARYEFFLDRSAESTVIILANSITSPIHGSEIFSRWGPRPYVGIVDEPDLAAEVSNRLRFFNLFNDPTPGQALTPYQSVSIPNTWTVNAAIGNLDFAWNQDGPNAMLWRGRGGEAMPSGEFGLLTQNHYFTQIVSNGVGTPLQLSSS